MENAAALNSILFAALRSINDKATPVDMDRAKATSMIVRDIISLAKVEASYAKEVGGSSTLFLTDPKELPVGIVGISQHRIK